MAGLSVNMNCHIVVDGLPKKIAPEKQEMFLKLFKSKLNSLKINFINVRLIADDETGHVIAAFIELVSPAAADDAIAKLHGFAFTKNDTFAAYRWSDFEKAASTPDTYQPLEDDDEAGSGGAAAAAATAQAEGGSAGGPVRDMTNTFLLDEQVRPQLLVKAGEGYDVTWSYLNTKNHKLDQIRSTVNNYDRSPWCELDKRSKKLQRPPAGKKPFPQWTSRGTYLISQNMSPAGAAQQVLKFWGGASMQLCAEISYSAGELDDLIVSNTEEYCIVKSKEIAFWSIAEGRMMRKFARGGRGQQSAAASAAPVAGAASGGAAAAAATGATAGDDGEDGNVAFQFNADDTLVGGVSRTAAGKHGLTFYAPQKQMHLVSEDPGSRFSQLIPGVHSMAFNPANPKMFAYVVEGDSSTQGWRVHIENLAVRDAAKDSGVPNPVPAFQTLTKRSWTNVSHIGLLWHPSGDFLAARLTKQHGEAKSVEYCIFRTHNNNVSAELFDPKGEARRFVFQPNAPRFALLVVPSGQSALIKRQHLVFYHIDPKVGIRKITDVEHDADRVIWAPKGCRCVAVNVDKSIIDFYGVPGCGPFPPSGPHQQMEKIAEKNPSESGALPNNHPCPTDFDWDPTGRYFCAVTSSLTHSIDNLMSVWNVNGRIILQQRLQRVSHAAFRPLPKSLLSEQEVARVRKELPKKSAEYDAVQLAEQNKEQEASNTKKAKVESRFLDILGDVHAWHVENNFAERRQALHKSAPMYRRLMEQAGVGEDATGAAPAAASS